MGTVTRFLVVSLVYGYIADTHAQSRLCTPANKQLCWDASDTKPLPNLPNVTWRQLMHYCRGYPEVRKCHKQLSANCTMATEMIYAGLDNEHRFMCEDEGKVYAQHMNCLSTGDLQKAEAACYDEYRTREEEVVRTNSLSFVARFCQHTETYIDCTKNAVNSYCGKEASSWTVELNERSLSPLMAYFQCPDWPRPQETPTTPIPPDTSNKTDLLIIGGTSAGVVVVAVLVIVLIVVVRRRRGRVSNADNRQNSGDKRVSGRNAGRGGNQSSSHRSNYDQSRGRRQARVAGTAVPNRQEDGLVSRRAAAPKAHTQSLALQPPPWRQASLPETVDRSHSTRSVPWERGNDEAYQQLSPGVESTYQHLKLGGDGATSVQLSPATKGAKFQRVTVTGGNDRRQPATGQNESKDNIYQELL